MRAPFRFPGPDRYELNARLKPALFVLLPCLIFAAVWAPEAWSALGALIGLLTSCGLIFLLAQISRWRGRRLQRRLGARLGPDSSASFLRHCDGRVDPETKARYHATLRRANLTVPTREEEEADPTRADNSYKACVTWLLSQTRDKTKFYLLAEENIAYGYRRNVFALRCIALPLLIASLAGNSTLLWLRWPNVDTRFVMGAAVEVGMLGILGAWIWLVNESFVADASDAYAERLLACCDTLEGSPSRSGGRRR